MAVIVRFSGVVALAVAGDGILTSKERTFEHSMASGSGYVQVAAKDVFGIRNNAGVARSSWLQKDHEETMGKQLLTTEEYRKQREDNEIRKQKDDDHKEEKMDVEQFNTQW